MIYSGLIKSLVVSGFIFLLAAPAAFCSKTVVIEQKPQLEIQEMVVAASAPELAKGHKNPIRQFEIDSASGMVSTAVARSPLGFPEVLDILDAPTLSDEKVIRPPCLLPILKPFMGTKGKLQAAALAARKNEWEKVIELLTPVALKYPDSPEAPKALYFIGRGNQKLHNLSAATNAFDRLRRKYPENPLAEYATYSLGWIYIQSHNIPRAIEMIETFRKQFPNSPLMPYSRYLQAATQYASRDYSGALETLQGIVAGYPLFPYKSRVQFWIAENLFFTNQIKRANINYNMYIENYPDGLRVAEARFGRAFCRLEMNDIDGALSEFAHLAKSSSNRIVRTDSAFQAGKLYLLRKDPSRAVDFFKIVINQTDPDSERHIEASAWIYFNAGQYSEAEKTFRLAAQTTKIQMRKTELSFIAAMCVFLQGKYAQSAELFHKISKPLDNPVAASALADAGISELKTGDLNAAYRDMKTALDSGYPLKDRPVYMLYSAEILYRLKKYPESLALFRQLEKEKVPPEIEPEIYRGIAWNYYSRRQWDKAAEAFNRFVQKYPDSIYQAEALLRQAECYFNADEYEKAREKFNALIHDYPLHPETFEARLLNARIKWVEDDFEGAAAAFEEALKYARNGAQRQKVHLLQGDLARDEEKYDRAAELYEQAFQDDPGSVVAPQILLKMAGCFYSEKHFEQARKIYRRIITDFPKSAETTSAQYSIGLIYFQENRLDDYLQECRQTADTHPGSQQGALALMGATDILIDQGRFSEAVAILHRLQNEFAAVIDPQQVHFRLAKVLAENNQPAESLMEYKKLLKDFPYGLYAADAAIALGNNALELNKPEEALEYFELVRERFPEHPRIDEALFRGAITNRKLGNDSDAEKELKQLIQTNPESEYYFPAQYELSCLYVEKDRCEDAKPYLEKSRSASDRNIAAGANYLTAKCLEKQGKSREALNLYLKISYLYSRQNDIVFKALTRAGKISRQAGKTADARRLFEKALRYAHSEKEKKEARKALNQLAEVGGSE